MKKKEIFNQYAIEQGYDDFNHLILDDMFEGDLDNTMKTINAVTDLIQEELKKKIAKIEDIYAEDFNEFGDAYAVIGTIKESILNTEIL